MLCSLICSWDLWSLFWLGVDLCHVSQLVSHAPNGLVKILLAKQTIILTECGVGSRAHFGVVPLCASFLKTIPKVLSGHLRLVFNRGCLCRSGVEYASPHWQTGETALEKGRGSGNLLSGGLSVQGGCSYQHLTLLGITELAPLLKWLLSQNWNELWHICALL